MSPKSPVAPPNPARRQWLLLLISGTGLMLSGLSSSLGSRGDFSGPFIAAMGSLVVGLALYSRQAWPAAQAVNLALNATLAGRLTEAEAGFSAADTKYRLGYIRRVIAVNRAWIALRRGDLERTVALATEAITRPLGLFNREIQRGNILDARGLRAVALASLGDRVGAEADCAAISESPLALPNALARAELARALLLEQAGDRGALAAHLTRNRRLLLEHTHPRERAIVRAYQRMLDTKATSGYRHGASRDQVASVEPLLADWVAKLAPAAAAFVGAEKGHAGAPGAAATGAQAPLIAPAAAAAAQARFKLKPTRNLRKVVVLYAVLIGMFVGIWQFLAPTPGPQHHSHPVPPVPPEPSSGVASVLGFSALMMVVLVGAVGWRLRRQQARNAELRAAMVTLARGDHASAMSAFTALTRGPPLIAAQALLMLATETERLGDLPAAQALCERGIASCAPAPIAASNMLLPSLFAEHALLLAAQGQSAEASAELALIEQRHPAYALLDTVRFRISLLDRARQGDFAGAARIAETSADLALTVRDELLADLVRVIADPESRGSQEAERLRKELRGDTVSAAWVEKVAPRVAAAFSGGAAAGASQASAAPGDAEAEREAMALEEAAREQARGWV